MKVSYGRMRMIKIISTKLLKNLMTSMNARISLPIGTTVCTKHRQDGTCDEFATALSLLVASCNYEKPDIAQRDQFVLQICDDNAREKFGETERYK